jgi:hypothetical protein
MLFYQLVTVVYIQSLVKSSIYVSPHMNTIICARACMHACIFTCKAKVFRVRQYIIAGSSKIWQTALASGYWLRAGRSGDRILLEGARFYAPVQIGPGAHPASCTIGTKSFPGVKSGRGVTLTPHPLLEPWSWKSRAIPLLPLWAVRPVQSLSACTRAHFTSFWLRRSYKTGWRNI